MSEQKLLDQFDISLGEEVLNDVRALGKSFKKEIWESGIGGGLLGCIFLDKTEQDVLRVQVKVFNSGEASKSSVPQESQTDHTGSVVPQIPPTQESAAQAVQVTEEKRQQTDGEQQEHQSSQTDVNKQADRTCQTPVAKLQETPMQTDIKQMAEKLSQTRRKEYCEMIMQTEQLPTQQRAMQVEPASGVGIPSQTDPLPVTHSMMQTEPKPIREAVSQTEPKPIAEKGVLATCTMQDMIMQTQYMGIEKQVQAQPPLTEAVAQTDIKTYRSLDIQVKPEIKDRNLQTSREFLHDVECETDTMIIIDPEDQCENDCQTDPMRVIDPLLDCEAQIQTDNVKVIYPETMCDNVAETDFVRCIDPLQEVENGMQTDEVHVRDYENLVENVAQTEDVRVSEVVELVEGETQTTLVWVCGLQQREEDEGVVFTSPTQPELAPETQPDLEVPLPPPDFPDSQDTPSNSQASSMTSPFPTPEKNRPVNDSYSDMPTENEKYCQTDPVTIIIGDSSFLVNRLKDYASPPRGMGGLRTRGVRRRGGPMTRGGGPMMRGGMTRSSVPEEGEGPPQLTPEAGYSQPDDREMPVLHEEESKPRTPIQAAPRMKTEGGSSSGTVYHGVRHRQLERADLIPASKSGRFNCPFCNLTFNESALLYRHLQLTHGTPRASNRRARRRGTIILLEDGRKIVENGKPKRQPTGRRRGRRSAHAIPSGDEELYQETDKYTVLQDPDYSEEPMPGEDSYEGEDLVEGEEEAEEGEVTTVHIQQGEDGEVTTVQVLEGDVTEDGQVIVHTTEVHEEGEVIVQQQEIEEANGPNVTQQEDVQVDQGENRRAFSCPFCPKNFTKSSALYVHLQNSHKGEKQRMRMPRGSRIKYPAAGGHMQFEEGEVEAEEGEVEPGEVQPQVAEEETEEGEVEPGEVVLAEGEEHLAQEQLESEDEWPEREAELEEEKVKQEKDDTTPRRGRGRPPKRKAVSETEELEVSPKKTRKSLESAEPRRSSLRRK